MQVHLSFSLLPQIGLLDMQTSTLTSPGKLKNNQNVISTQMILFCGPLIMNKTALVRKKLEGTVQIKQTNNRRLKLVVSGFPRILEELL